MDNFKNDNISINFNNGVDDNRIADTVEKITLENSIIELLQQQQQLNQVRKNLLKELRDKNKKIKRSIQIKINDYNPN